VEAAVARILVVDDDGHIRQVVRFALEQAGFQVVEAGDAAQAWSQFSRSSPDLVVLDILMPEGDGLDVCRRIRAKSDIPIIFLSSKDTELDRVLGLELGADDYLIKPFSPRELLARVKAVLRRRHEKTEDAAPALHACGPLEMDLSRHRCRWRGKEVLLTVTEFAVLESLIAAPGRVLTRDQLVDRAYGLGHAITDRTVDSHIRRIRQKISAVSTPEPDPIETVYGLGYRLREDLS
jgi:two-component system OmpR family response regulator